VTASRGVRDRLELALIYLGLSLFAFVAVLPFLHTIARSFSAEAPIARAEVYVWPVNFTLDAYERLIMDGAFWRAYVNSFIITVLGTSERVTVTITWAGGRTTTGETARPVALLQQLSYFPQIKERVRELAGQGHRAEAIARRLHAEGFRPARGRGNRISASAVKEILRELGCLPPPVRTRPSPPPGEEPGRDELWLDDLAAELDMPAVTLYATGSPCLGTPRPILNAVSRESRSACSVREWGYPRSPRRWVWTAA
jgi:hypothetical protein